MSQGEEWSKLVKLLGKRIEAIPTGMLRGRTVRDAVLILDEAQNCSYAQLKCALTRIGSYGRLILTGDADQSDRYRPEESPLMDITRKLSDLDTVSVVRFTHADQQRDELVNAILERL
jgi:phosphate starvation-inducible PhoH-like protein